MGAKIESAAEGACCAGGERLLNCEEGSDASGCNATDDECQLTDHHLTDEEEPLTHALGNARRSIVRTFDCTTQPRLVIRPIQSASFGLARAALAMETRRPAGRRALRQPFGFSPGQVEERVDGSPVLQLQPAPFDRTGALAFLDRPCQRLGQLGTLPSRLSSLSVSVKVTSTLPRIEVKPAQLPIPHAVLPGPSPDRTHEAHLFADTLEREQPIAHLESGPPVARADR